MKKKILLLVMIVTIMMCSGCGQTKTLVCTKTEKTTGMTIESKMTTDFKNNKIGIIKMDMNVKLDSDYVKYKDTIKKSLEEQYGAYKDAKGVTYSTEAKDDVINFNLTVDNKKIEKKTREGLKLSGSENYSVNKKTLEDQGYSCK